MGSLVQTIQDAEKRRAVVDDCVRLIEAEVSSKRGISGMGIKAAFKAVRGLRPGMIPMAMNHLLDEFAAKLDPFWSECQASGKKPRSFFVERKGDVAEALLSITDARRDKADNRVMVRAYNGLRPKVVSYIGDAMPRVAELFIKHVT
jgi:hypothetical protein